MKKISTEQRKEEVEAIMMDWFSNKLKHIPREFINKENLFITNMYGFSLLHIVAKNGQIKDVPAELLTQENIMLTDMNGKSVMSCVAESGTFEDIPKELVTLHNLTIHGDPPVIHSLAIAKNLNKIPEEFLTEKTLLIRDDSQNTTLHTIARYGDIKQVPKNLLTDTTLLSEDKSSQTVLIEILSNQDPTYLPKHYISEEKLMFENAIGFRLIDIIILSCQVKKNFSYLEKTIKNFSMESLHKLAKLHSQTRPNIIENLLQKRMTIEKIKEETKKTKESQVHKGGLMEFYD